MSVERQTVGEPHKYCGRIITAHLMGPDLIGFIDGLEMPHFYLTLSALRAVGERMIDADIKEQENKNAKRRTNR